MSGLGDLAMSTGMGIAGELGKEIGYGIGNMTGYNQRMAQDQINQQQKLTDMQYHANYALMKGSYAEQQKLWDNTQAEAQVKHLKNAGLNPALIYAKGGAGGSTSGGGGASVGGASASDETSRQMANNQSTAMGLQLAKLQSEIDLNKSVAEVNRAQAGKAGAETETTEQSRNYLVEKLRQDGKGQWLNNLQEQYKMSGGNPDSTTVRNKNVDYGTVDISSTSLFTKEITTQIAQTEAQTNNAAAQALLTNNKAMGYFQELLNDTARSNAAGVQAAAAKLSAEFNSGEMQNAKFWIQMGTAILGSLTGGIIPFKSQTIK